MAANKVTKKNFKPSTAANSILVRAKQFNEMVDVLNDIIDGTTSVTEVEVGNGTAAAPSMSFTSDPDTGIYRSAADEVGVTAAGVGQVKVTDGTVEPITDNDIDLGTASKEFKNVYLQGVITQSNTTDATTKDTGAIITEGGIGVEKAVFVGTSLTAATSVITDLISEKTGAAGVTIDGALIKDAAFDTNVAAAGVTLAGTTLAADGTDANISITITPKGTGGISTAAGAAATPAYSFTGQTDMGIYKSSATELGISTEGTFRARISSAGLEMAASHPVTASAVKINEPGTVNTGVTAVHYGDGRNFTTILTVNQVDAIDVADAAALADGYLLYTFPAGPIVVNSAYMTMAVTLAEDTTATADVGLGTTVGSGANATLNLVGGGAAENILTGQTSADCNGTATVKTVADQILVIEAAGDHTVYFNVANTWADTAGADLTGDIAGTVTINWTKMS